MPTPEQVAASPGGGLGGRRSESAGPGRGILRPRGQVAPPPGPRLSTAPPQATALGVPWYVWAGGALALWLYLDR